MAYTGHSGSLAVISIAWNHLAYRSKACGKGFHIYNRG